MNRLLTYLILIIAAVGCGGNNKLNDEKGIPTKIKIETQSTNYSLNEISCDSLRWSNRCTSDLIFENLKINKTTFVILSEKNGEKFLEQTIKSKQSNRIDISSLKKGIYYLELSDWTGPVCRNVFMKK